MLLLVDVHGNVWDCSNKPGLESWLVTNYRAKIVEPVGLVPEEAHEWRLNNNLPCDCEECLTVPEPEVDEETPEIAESDVDEDTEESE